LYFVVNMCCCGDRWQQERKIPLLIDDERNYRPTDVYVSAIRARQCGNGPCPLDPLFVARRYKF
jgi:hypothetical protein